jgi:hypothetical protein
VKCLSPVNRNIVVEAAGTVATAVVVAQQPCRYTQRVIVASKLLLCDWFTAHVLKIENTAGHCVLRFGNLARNRYPSVARETETKRISMSEAAPRFPPAALMGRRSAAQKRDAEEDWGRERWR